MELKSLLSAISFSNLISLLALIISAGTFYYNFKRKGKVKTSVTGYTLNRLGVVLYDEYDAAFSLQIGFLNTGAIVREVTDIVIKLRSNSKIFVYTPIGVWDLELWMKNPNHQLKYGDAIKNIAPLPLLIQPNSEHIFSNHILFMPEDKNVEILNANILKQKLQENKKLTLEVHICLDNENKYHKVEEHIMSSSSIDNILSGQIYSGDISSRTVSKRKYL